MAVTVTMPRYGATMEEGLVGSWLVNEGDAVSKGDIICEIESEKLANAFEAPQSGILVRILCGEGEERKCGEPIALIAEEGEDLSALEDSPRESSPAAPPAESLSSGKEKGPEESFVLEITPRAKQLAETLGIDYSRIPGTGLYGAVTRKDIRAYASTASISSEKVQAQEVAAGDSVWIRSGEKIPPVRKFIARRMSESLAATAQASFTMDADLTSLVAGYGEYKKRFAEIGLNLTYTALFIKAMALALPAVPDVRKSFRGEDMYTTTSTGVGFAVDAEKGLVVPVVKNAAEKSVSEICGEMARLVEKAKSGTLEAEDQTGSAVTLTNLGMLGVRYCTPVLNPPESVIIGAGVIHQVPSVAEGELAFPWMGALSLTHDHRVIDGAPAARYLSEVIRLLQDITVLL